MNNIEPFNDEDSKIWSVLEAFDFDAYRNNSELRVDLYKKLIESLGYCRFCSHFIKAKNWCNLLEAHAGTMDRCCDFERVEKEIQPAFDIMSEKYINEQTRISDAVKINKYTHWSNKITPGKQKESTDEGED